MEIKKNPKSNLENYSKIFIQIGLVLALYITYAAIEKKTYDKTIEDLGTVTMNALLEEEIPITERVEPVQPKTPPPPTPEKIEVVEDDKEIEETVIESTETDETEEVFVVYQPEYGEKGIWIRPLTMFTETIIRDGKELQRFAKVPD